jgi:aryl-alcohol dehydrogenase-like predicted oxidoreductase
MEYRQLGQSGLRVSVLSLGTMTYGGRGDFAKTGAIDVDGARRHLDMVVDAGVNLIDTADIYSFGLSEEIVGKVVAGRRDRILLATKARMPMGDGPNDAGLSRHHLIQSLEASLRRLGTDYVDLYQVHEWDGQTPLAETLDTLDSMVRSGKVRYIGCSNYAAWQLTKALGIAERLGYQRFVSQQIHYSLQAREAEYEMIPAGIDQGVGVLVWSPLAGGLLSGTYRRGQDSARRLAGWNEPPVRDENLLYNIVDLLVEIAEGRNATPAQVALAWLLRKPGVSSLIVGARTDDQLANNLKAADLRLTDEEQGRLDAASALPLLYPFWHQAATASDRLSPADLTLLAPHIRR